MFSNVNIFYKLIIICKHIYQKFWRFASVIFFGAAEDNHIRHSVEFPENFHVYFPYFSNPWILPNAMRTLTLFELLAKQRTMRNKLGLFTTMGVEKIDTISMMKSSLAKIFVEKIPSGIITSIVAVERR